MTNTDNTHDGHEAVKGGRRPAYDYQWRAFTSWCLDRQEDVPLPVPASAVGEYLSCRAAAGAKHSTLMVIVAAIARHHTDLELPNPCEDPVVESILAESARRAPPVPPRSLPLDLNAYRAIRKTAYLPRPGRGGWEERSWSAWERGSIDVAIIGLMRDGMLRVKDVAVLRWNAIEHRPDGTGSVTIGEGDTAVTRVLSADTMRLLDAIRSDAADDERVLGLMPNQITYRIGAAAEQAGLGSGYGGESPRLGMLKDLEELGAVPLGERVEDEAP